MRFNRTARLLGADALIKLKKSKVAVFGIGGVGSYTVEALARSGVGTLMLVDSDVVAESNINRQLIALSSTVGRQKTAVAAERILDINPDATVIEKTLFFDSYTLSQFDLSDYDYIVDAIDTVTSKLLLIQTAKQLNVPIISVMGAGNKLNPTDFRVDDISKTTMCPLARVMRRELVALGIKNVKVVYSLEKAITPLQDNENTNKRATPASVAFVPSVAGLIAASEVIKDLIK